MRNDRVGRGAGPVGGPGPALFPGKLLRGGGKTVNSLALGGLGRRFKRFLATGAAGFHKESIS